MTPYFVSPDGSITIYHGRAEDVLPTLTGDSVIVTDPPYGIALDTANHKRQRSTALALANDYPRVHGDDEPFDPSPLLRFRTVVLFGANHDADRLPASSAWLIWDKTAGLQSNRALGFNDNADAELIWTNGRGTARILKHQWIGLMKATERDQRRLHPTQKPVALMRWIISHYSEPDDLIVDPYGGSGTTMRACMDLGRRGVMVEINEAYCEKAANRSAQTVLPLGGVA